MQPEHFKHAPTARFSQRTPAERIPKQFRGLIKEGGFLGTAFTDMTELLKLPAHKQRRYFLGINQQYFDEAKKHERTLTCYDGCKKQIQGARDLRRRFGRNWCAKCFNERRAEHREDEQPHDRPYFDLIAAVMK